MLFRASLEIAFCTDVLRVSLLHSNSYVPGIIPKNVCVGCMYVWITYNILVILLFCRALCLALKHFVFIEKKNCVGDAHLCTLGFRVFLCFSFKGTGIIAVTKPLGKRASTRGFITFTE